MTFEQLRSFLSRVQRDPALRRQVEEAITPDEVARLAQELGFSVSGSDCELFCVAVNSVLDAYLKNDNRIRLKQYLLCCFKSSMRKVRYLI